MFIAKVRLNFLQSAVGTTYFARSGTAKALWKQGKYLCYRIGEPKFFLPMALKNDFLAEQHWTLVRSITAMF